MPWHAPRRGSTAGQPKQVRVHRAVRARARRASRRRARCISMSVNSAAQISLVSVVPSAGFVGRDDRVGARGVVDAERSARPARTSLSRAARRARRGRGTGASRRWSCRRPAGRPRPRPPRARRPGAAGSTSPSTIGWNGIIPTVASSGHRAAACARDAARRRERRASAVGVGRAPSSREQRVAHQSRRASSSSVLNVAPLCTIAPRNSPRAAGDAQQVQHDAAAGRLAEHRDARRDRRRTPRCCRAPTRARAIASRSPQFATPPNVARVEEAERAEPVVARDDHDVLLRGRSSAPSYTGCDDAPMVNAPPGNHTSTGRVGAALGVGRPHVQREARVLVGRPRNCMPGTSPSSGPPTGCGAAGPNAVASRVPVHDVTRRRRLRTARPSRTERRETRGPASPSTDIGRPDEPARRWSRSRSFPGSVRRPRRVPFPQRDPE